MGCSNAKQVLPNAENKNGEPPQPQPQETPEAPDMEAPAPEDAADSSPATPPSAPTTTTLLPPGSTWHKHGGEELEPLLAFTTLVDVRWLLKFAQREIMLERKGVVPAWQELPAEAEVRLEALRASKWEHGLPVGVLSYGWAL